MSMTRTKPTTNGTGPDLFARLGNASPRRHRNWPRVGAAVALAVLCGVVFVLLLGNAGSRHPVLALTRSVPAGTQLTAGDFTTVGVAADPGLAPIPASDLATVVQRRAAVALEPGTLLTPGDLTSAPTVASGSTTVGLELKPGQAPGDLAPGENVMVVATATSSGPGTSSSSPTVLVPSARVLAVSAPSANSSGDAGLTVVVPVSDAPAVLNAASAGTIAVAALGPLGGS
jgi:hypothetical protein